MARRQLTVLTMLAVLLLSAGFTRPDLGKDREECTNQLVGVATCLPYVSGDAKAPTPDCCAGFKQVLAKSVKCICILIRDRNDPQLGLKINATLAVTLPTACHQPAPNISRCTDLLHLDPNSSLAKEFESLGKLEGKAPAPAPPSKGNSSMNSETNSDGGRRGWQMGWWWLGVDTVMAHALLIIHIVFIVFSSFF